MIKLWINAFKERKIQAVYENKDSLQAPSPGVNQHPLYDGLVWSWCARRRLGNDTTNTNQYDATGALAYAHDNAMTSHAATVSLSTIRPLCANMTQP